MIDLTGVQHHPVLASIVDVICARKRTNDRGFFNAMTAYFLGKMASCMRAIVITPHAGDIPVNIFTLALAESGFGKGTAKNLIENELLMGFKRRLVGDTMLTLSDACIWRHANERALRDNTEPQIEFDKLKAVYRDLGTYLFSFKECTSAAIIQMRDKLLLSDCGSINLQVDEIGLNLSKTADALGEFLELYDRGLLDPKLTKNTNENTRLEQIDGPTPTNLLLFGSPSKLFDGGQTETQFYELLRTGYARRCIFGLGLIDPNAPELTPAEVYAMASAKQNTAVLQQLSAQFHGLADAQMFGWRMELEEPVALKLIEYQLACEKAAKPLWDVNEIRAAEITHRHDKALKLAGVYAFIDQSSVVELDHLLSAILLVEGSGESFQKILTREPNYERLAKYIAGSGKELTQPDLLSALTFYKGNPPTRAAMMTHAIAWGYKNNIIIKRAFGANNIEFISGETLKETNLDEISLSYSSDWAYNYEHELVPFDRLPELTQAEDVHWANHAFKNGHRADDNVIPGFNMLVFDVDGGVPLHLAHELLKEIKFVTHTTKRHTEEAPRFRLLIPINFHLQLDKAEYAELVNDVIAYLPFPAKADVDDASAQRSKKWQTNHLGTYHLNAEGELFNILPFIPKTSQNETFKKDMKVIEDLDNLERWFATRMIQGDRNNTLLKYALLLVDNGLGLTEVDQLVHALNQKVANPMDTARVNSSIMVTAAKAVAKRAAKQAA